MTEHLIIGGLGAAFVLAVLLLVRHATTKRDRVRRKPAKHRPRGKHR